MMAKVDFMTSSDKSTRTSARGSLKARIQVYDVFDFQLTAYNALMKKSTTPTKGSSIPVGKKPFDANEYVTALLPRD